MPGQAANRGRFGRRAGATAIGIAVATRFRPEECAERARGVVRCLSATPTKAQDARLRLVPLRAGRRPTGEWKVTLQLPSFDITSSQVGPASVVVSTGSGHLIGTAETCRTVRQGGLVTCR